MGLIFGKISVATPKYDLLKSTDNYEIRKYPSAVIAEVTYDPSETKDNNKDGGFRLLARYIGAFGTPQNSKPQKIAMTAPVVTKGEGKLVTMQFILPEEYKKAEEAPKPLDERVVVREEGEMKYGVVKFGGVASDDVVEEEVRKLKEGLEKDGFKVVGEFVLARYNPPWTLPMFRTNEVMIPVD